ncbi:hypothetical protein N658DRAFT_222817 [Parathielavia hyrcaniae]|uniref:Uncharacterized protein n=1 Tax=Parathielavia hyrcaniae TaxID=113614 RepID=A0AAN6PUZ3_9PEZI|nr:hypothetical protein N658DRAFT_222817 [Parathielavia hyrcaniae]
MLRDFDSSASTGLCIGFRSTLLFSRHTCMARNRAQAHLAASCFICKTTYALHPSGMMPVASLACDANIPQNPLVTRPAPANAAEFHNALLLEPFRNFEPAAEHGTLVATERAFPGRAATEDIRLISKRRVRSKFRDGGAVRFIEHVDGIGGLDRAVEQPGFQVLFVGRADFAVVLIPQHHLG